MAKGISTAEAAAIIGASPQFVRIAMQQGALNIGSCVKMSSIWTYNISSKLLAEYTGKDIDKELEIIRGEKYDRSGDFKSHV
ncbi:MULTISPECIES: hypothetical protein [Clostridia]|jgi:hypothetical protein|uniref:Uncharacterized protein n=1 Tax=Butyribacter intestini TaxID=1703332 RepID=A0AAW3JU85_9FIRM|nr:MULTISPECIES: hypothetical protein [Clostridia]KQC85851.1 hypothetical protein APZ18_01205 [Butyribacter intestini]RHP24149.1 hypothetical protein DWZ63_11470 [Clostridium sp. AF34-13]RHU76949.1 hypothetical protein DXC30_01235 [Butyribacter intestini]